MSLRAVETSLLCRDLFWPPVLCSTPPSSALLKTRAAVSANYTDECEGSHILKHLHVVPSGSSLCSGIRIMFTRDCELPRNPVAAPVIEAHALPKPPPTHPHTHRPLDSSELKEHRLSHRNCRSLPLRFFLACRRPTRISTPLSEHEVFDVTTQVLVSAERMRRQHPTAGIA